MSSLKAYLQKYASPTDPTKPKKKKKKTRQDGASTRARGTTFIIDEDTLGFDNNNNSDDEEVLDGAVIVDGAELLKGGGVSTTTNAFGGFKSDSWEVIREGERRGEHDELELETGEDAPVVEGVIDDSVEVSHKGYSDDRGRDRRRRSPSRSPDRHRHRRKSPTPSVSPKRNRKSPTPSPPRRRRRSPSPSPHRARRPPSRSPSRLMSPPRRSAGPPLEQAATIHRDKHGRVLNISAQKALERHAQQKRDEDIARNAVWGKGVTQLSDREKLQKQLEQEKNASFAVYKDDQELNARQMERERWGDPMAFMTKSKKGKSAKKVYQGPSPPNRFGILPGYRWDGVDRSNGFEKQWFLVRNEKRVNEVESWKWRSEDM